ncbi:hypothetical protein [Derxia gummosa]|uniref:Uncharacterized protein n=1 Tax=Derxia gummosa DSM 723 TaxID=1121388 RepID=A0A8B6XCM4_9BURK|nr:hypothetical protein [Derxia gummosa]
MQEFRDAVLIETGGRADAATRRTSLDWHCAKQISLLPIAWERGVMGNATDEMRMKDWCRAVHRADGALTVPRLSTMRRIAPICARRRSGRYPDAAVAVLAQTDESCPYRNAVARSARDEWRNFHQIAIHREFAAFHSA